MLNDLVILRGARLDDVPLLDKWDRAPHVIAAVTDDQAAHIAFGDDQDWADELAAQSNTSKYYIAEFDGRPIGALQIIDPCNEATHYWGPIEENLRAIDIWIGETDCLGKGYGTTLMRRALALCFSNPLVKAVLIDPLYSNKKAHRFYQRLGFKPVERRLFHLEDDCLVHKLMRNDWQMNFPEDSRLGLN